MSFPVFKDFDKSTADIFGEDFDTKYTLKIKSAGPADVAVTTALTFDPSKEQKIAAKLTTKWAHASGFTMDKLEMGPTGDLAFESSLTGLAPGLKTEFKSNIGNKHDGSFVYKAPYATVTGEYSHVASKASGSVTVGHGAFVAGGSADIGIEKYAIGSTAFVLGAGYSEKGIFAGLRTQGGFSEYTGLASYDVSKVLTVAGKVTYTPKATGGAIAAVYKCNPNTVIKVKAGACGNLYASVKQQLEKKFVVVGSAKVPTSLNGIQFGVNATLG